MHRLVLGIGHLVKLCAKPNVLGALKSADASRLDRTNTREVSGRFGPANGAGRRTQGEKNGNMPPITPK